MLRLHAFATLGLSASLACALGACSSSSNGSPVETTDAATDAGASTNVDAATNDSATKDADATDATDATACAVDATYTFGQMGGLGFYRDTSTLTAPDVYTRTRHYSEIDAGNTDFSCTPPLPACGGDAGVDLSDIARDIADPDVQAAFALTTAPVYGFDGRPADGAIFGVLRADGHGFYAGADCGDGGFCHGPVPAGIARLAADLTALDAEELRDPSCSAFQSTH